MANEPTHKYQLHIFWSAEDDAFLVEVNNSRPHPATTVTIAAALVDHSI